MHFVFLNYIIFCFIEDLSLCSGSSHGCNINKIRRSSRKQKRRNEYSELDSYTNPLNIVKLESFLMGQLLKLCP